MRKLLNPGNSKLGESVYSFSLPAGDSCLGQTAICASHCYAKSGFFRYANVQSKYQDAYVLVRDTPGLFVAQMNRELATLRPHTVRIHASGDFFSLSYVGAWAEIMRRNPSTSFYAYTRSWRIPTLRDALEAVAENVGNFRLWFSCDQESGIPETGHSIAWMQTATDDLPPVPLRAGDVVFRTRKPRAVPTKRIGLALVCPKENGNKQEALTTLTCGTCRYCL